MRFFLLFFACFFFLISNLHSQAFERISFPVFEDGRQLANPFAGGLNAPQFNLADINRNGQKEMVVFDRDGGVVLVFENFGSPGNPDYRYNPELGKIFPSMINFMQIRDYNRNGIPDIFTYAKNTAPGIQVYTGSENDGELSFELLELDQEYPFNVLTFRSSGGLSNLPVLNIDLPHIGDVTGDGDMDIVVFTENGGNAQFFRNRTVEEGRPAHHFVYRLEDICWGKFFENEFPADIFLSENPNSCAGLALDGSTSSERHAGSTITLFDQNGNGLLDALIGDLTTNRISFLQNGGTPSNAWMVEKDIQFPSYDRPVELEAFLSSFILDVDGDGKEDLLVSVNDAAGFLETKYNVWYYKNVGTGNEKIFEFQQEDFLVGDMIDVGSYSSVAVVDVDGDGLLDLVVGNFGKFINYQDRLSSLHFYRNIGTAEEPAFELVDTDLFGMSQFSSSTRAFAPVFYDMTGNGALDVIVGDFRGQLFYGENVAGPGEPIQVDVWEYPWMDINVGQYSTPAVADINGNGLPDLVIGERTANNVDGMRCGNLNYFENIGTRENPMFASDEFEAPNNPCFGRVLTFEQGFVRGFSTPTLYEPPNGDPMMLVGRLSGRLELYTDLDPEFGIEFSPEVEDFGEIRQGSNTQAVLADLNNNGMLEVVVANLRGGLAIYQSNISADGAVSSEDIPISDYQLEIYPNPTSGQFTIRLDQNCDAQLEIYLSDMNGRVVRNFRQTSCSETHSIEGLSSGVYFIKASDQRGSTYQSKLVVW